MGGQRMLFAAIGGFWLWGGAYSYRFICLRDEPFDCCSAGLDGPSGVFGFSAATLEGVLLRKPGVH